MKGVFACVIERNGKVLLKGSGKLHFPEYIVDDKNIMKELEEKLENDLKIMPCFGKLIHTHHDTGKITFFIKINDFNGKPENAKWYSKDNKKIISSHKWIIKLN